MPLYIHFEAPNMEKVEAELTQLGNIDFTSLWPLYRDELRVIDAKTYDSQGSSGMHGRWEDNDPRYAAKKERRGSNWIERLSGRTYFSLTEETSDSIFESTPNSMVFGTAVPYAYFQQTGFRTRLGMRLGLERKTRGIGIRHSSGYKSYVAPRRLFDLTDKDVRRLERIAHQWYIAKARRLGFSIVGREGGAGAALAAGRAALGEQFPVSEGI